ncbi:MAG: glycosyltransferase family 2 protein [bacterium]|nr:glycosyltransferase family 2 protein [bacterium]
MSKILYIVIPSYNESEVIEETSKRLLDKVSGLISSKKISKESRIVFVDDGSKDDTWDKIEKLNKTNPTFGGIKLSRNRGHQNALLAGLMTVKDKADFVISMDADLQDDIDAVDKMIDDFYNGSDIVYGVRNSRKTDTFFKKNTALFFYKLMSKMGVDSVYNHADYRLMSKRALDELANFREINLFLRGIVPLIGFKTSIVEYDRAERFAGESKYPLKKMINFAIDGITSFSVKPIRLVASLGFLISGVSILVLLYSLAQHILGNTVSGWTFVIFSIWILGGIQMVALGIIGEYIGKIYSEVKARPRFIIEKEI